MGIGDIYRDKERGEVYERKTKKCKQSRHISLVMESTPHENSALISFGIRICVRVGKVEVNFAIDGC